ncbi:hypothetical protein COCVIDRAFT_19972 [Bipolaris victoriae FI3]|uniref:FAD-binding domain-containing protein n=1 Tax=Bipolaris victoriae (strain FI3) TaxID=930091 RepID=W7E519_BIPV3|nr:hypothetical protein COCVIDRAFT_19972 [Bipolaris victoriae FI3]
MDTSKVNGVSSNNSSHHLHACIKDRKTASSHCTVNLPTTYPSQALRFLKRVGTEHSASDEINNTRPSSQQAQVKLNIVIVGAGLCGLSLAVALSRRGHSVRLLEQASQLGEVGAGIQIPPNSGRLLQRWNVLQHLHKDAVQPEGIYFRRWETGNTIGYTALGQTFQDDFDVPYYVLHRAHFHEALYQRALELGVSVKLGCRVKEYEDSKGSVVLESGQRIHGDLIIAADGINSAARATLFPDTNNEPDFHGFAAYRATVPIARMKEDPDIASMLDKPALNIWIGEDRHVMTYAIAGGESFNMVLSHIDHSNPASWAKRFLKEDVQKEFKGWDPRLTKIISLIDECLKWPLKVGRSLQTWTSPSSRLIIVGDAAHAMLPYMSQGAAMAVEDGAALAVVLNKITSLEELPFALRLFEKERMKRCGDMQNASTVNGYIWHFPDGPEQVARDSAMSAEVLGLPFTSSANQWSDPVTQWWAYGYDAESVMEEAWNKSVRELIARAAKHE